MLKQRQPHGFPIFFLTEMWERYGFYVLQSLLVFYALEQIHLSDSETYAMVGSFTALAYVNSIFGGLIADRFIVVMIRPFWLVQRYYALDTHY